MHLPCFNHTTSYQKQMPTVIQGTWHDMLPVILVKSTKGMYTPSYYSVALLNTHDSMMVAQFYVQHQTLILHISYSGKDHKIKGIHERCTGSYVLPRLQLDIPSCGLWSI
ncbi:hypothetical protein K492DRAFT_49206 [Lichtheimia hyalospora FSU 10163]|nr:hypothetical protein K492DRAFT_49206 [Lichtheimia hyalospora FSU 10163]